MAKCSGITRAGTACKGTPIESSQWCFVHHPEHVEERKRHGRRGGKRGGRGRPQAELAEVKNLLRGLAAGVLKGTTDRADAAVAGQLLGTVIRAIGMELKVKEATELEGRLEELERLLEARDAGGHRRGA